MPQGELNNMGVETMPIKGKMSQEHKDKISNSQKRRWSRVKEIVYDMDAFTMNEPMTTVLGAINARCKEGWEHEQTIIKNGVFVMYKKGG